MKNEFVVSGNDTESTKRNNKKFAAMKAVFEGRSVCIMDDGKEYESVVLKLNKDLVR